MRGEYSYKEHFLPSYACEHLAQRIEDRETSKGTVGLKGTKVDKSIRDSNVLFIKRDNGPFDFFTGIDDWIAEVNEYWFGVDYNPRLRSAQLTEYHEGQYYKPHQDAPIVSGDIPYHRKIGFTIQLSDSNDYEGGDLRLHWVREQPPKEILRKQGTIIAFPSMVIHEVTKVTRGTRHSLVGWYSGPRWR